MTKKFYFNKVLDMNIEEAKKCLLSTRKKSDLINYLIVKHAYKSYLEIGVCSGDTFHRIDADRKDGVDIKGPAANHLMTSDAFFKQNEKTFDLVFIDGMHLRKQVVRDVENALSCLNERGTIVLHDCLPKHFFDQVTDQLPDVSWTGDVWKAAAHIRMTMPAVHFCVLQMDLGCGIITPGRKQNLYPFIPSEQLTWSYYSNHHRELLNIIRVEDWVSSHLN